MSQSNPISNPFESGPVGAPVGGGQDAQDPFQMAGGGGVQPSQPTSPFEAVGNQVPFGAGQAPPARQSQANPFQIAQGGQQPQAPVGHPVQPQVGGQAAQPQAGGGFEMKGFPPGPAPMNQLDAAPLGGGGEEASPPSADPFAGMALPQISENPTEPAAVAEPPAEEVEVEDFSAPAPAPEPPQEAKAAPKKKSSFVPAKAAAAEVITSETRQLELRAIFGVDHELSNQEIMQRARGLPGILHVTKANSKEVAALQRLQGCASKLGLGEDEPIVISCSEGFIDFLIYEDTTLAILRKDDYAPGVRETLIIIARELEKL